MSKSERGFSFTLEKPNKARLPKEVRDANINRQAGAMHDKRGDRGPQESEWDEDRLVLTEKEKRNIFERALKEFNDWSGGDNQYLKIAQANDDWSAKIYKLKTAIAAEIEDPENNASKSILEVWLKDVSSLF